MIGVFDASVLVKLFLNEPDSQLAINVVRRAGTIVVPDVVRVEVTSAITRAFRNEAIDRDEAECQIGEWKQFRTLGNVRFVPFSDLLESATKLSLELKHPLMDCFYVALALREKITFITSDEPLITAATEIPNIRHLRTFLDS